MELKVKNKDNVVIAKQAVLSFKKAIFNSKSNKPEDLIKKLHLLRSSILSARTKDPLTKNAVDCILYNIKPYNILKLKHELNQRISYALNHLTDSHTKIADYGSKKIKKGMSVYVHGYSSSIINLLLKAKKQGINFEVSTTETNPFLSGYLVASELSKHKIHTQFYSDLALRQALKKADIILMGAAAIAENGQIYSELGSELIAELADKFDVPVYVCTDCWKFSPKTTSEYNESKELRPHHELWKNPPKEVKVLNYEYEKINPRLIAGIITEKGIYKPSYLVSEIKKVCPWIK